MYFVGLTMFIFSTGHPYGEWMKKKRKDITKTEAADDRLYDDSTATFAQATFGWGLEDIGAQKAGQRVQDRIVVWSTAAK